MKAAEKKDGGVGEVTEAKYDVTTGDGENSSALTPGNVLGVALLLVMGLFGFVVFAGVCTAVGAKVTKVKVGDHVGVGCRVGACLECKMCKAGEEQKCSKGAGTYDTDDKSGIAATFPSGGKTIGGYTSKMVVHEHFAIIIRDTVPFAERETG